MKTQFKMGTTTMSIRAHGNELNIDLGEIQGETEYSADEFIELVKSIGPMIGDLIPKVMQMAERSDERRHQRHMADALRKDK